MKLEIEFHDSEISEIKVGPKEIEIYFSRAVIIGIPQGENAQTLVVPAIIKVGNPKYKSLPKGKLSDGEIYGIPGKALNGHIPVNFNFDRACELVFTDQNDEHTIHGKSLRVHADLSHLPSAVKH